MTEVKVSLSVIVPGSVMLSKEECLKTTQKVIERKSKSGKVFKKTINTKVEDYDKMDKHSIRVMEIVDKKPVYETITVYTRKAKPATQTINLSKDAYEYMVSNECPYWMKPKVWVSMNKKMRLENHFQRLCESLNGLSYTYEVFED